MITVKTNCYNANEKGPLAEALKAAVNKFINNYCTPQAECQTCEYRHLCYDLIKARNYAVKLAQEVGKL